MDCGVQATSWSALLSLTLARWGHLHTGTGRAEDLQQAVQPQRHSKCAAGQSSLLDLLVLSSLDLLVFASCLAAASPKAGTALAGTGNSTWQHDLSCLPNSCTTSRGSALPLRGHGSIPLAASPFLWSLQAPQLHSTAVFGRWGAQDAEELPELPCVLKALKERHTQMYCPILEVSSSWVSLLLLQESLERY